MPSLSEPEMRRQIRSVQNEIVWLWEDRWVTIRSCVGDRDWLSGVDLTTVERDCL